MHLKCAGLLNLEELRKKSILSASHHGNGDLDAKQHSALPFSLGEVCLRSPAPHYD